MNNDVPCEVPSVVHNSVPVAAVVALKKTRPANATNSPPRNELVGNPDLTPSAKIFVPAAVPSLTQSWY